MASTSEGNSRHFHFLDFHSVFFDVRTLDFFFAVFSLFCCGHGSELLRQFYGVQRILCNVQAQPSRRHEPAFFCLKSLWHGILGSSDSAGVIILQRLGDTLPFLPEIGQLGGLPNGGDADGRRRAKYGALVCR